MVALLSEVPQEGSSVFSLFSLIKLHLASHPLASSYSHVAVSSVFCAQYIHISAPNAWGPVKLTEQRKCFYSVPAPKNFVSRDRFGRPAFCDDGVHLLMPSTTIGPVPITVYQVTQMRTTMASMAAGAEPVVPKVVSVQYGPVHKKLSFRRRYQSLISGRRVS